MYSIEFSPTADGWLRAAARLISQCAQPEDILWRECGAAQDYLPGLSAADEIHVPAVPCDASIPAPFVSIVGEIACHSIPDRWRLLYSILYRLKFEQPALLRILSDPEVRALHRLRAQVRKAAYRMKALVRFRRTGEGGDERYLAWHQPEHDVLPLVAPFFVERFGAMRWSIITPARAAHWDGSSVQFGPGLPRHAAPSDDELDDLWRVYYATTFNPARENYVAMRAQLPVRHWATLPESRLIGPLRRAAAGRLKAQEATRQGMAPVPDVASVHDMEKAARHCAGCELHIRATQTVFGRGPQTARLVLVGEQPGDEEDRAGIPFVGPAGRVLQQALADAGLDREAVYVTNAVKHFKFVLHGSERRHQRPAASEIVACRPWLEAELRLIRPELVIALGATAAQALLGRTIPIMRHRGQIVWRAEEPVLVTYHPSAVLRTKDDDSRRAVYEALVTDLRRASRLVGTTP